MKFLVIFALLFAALMCAAAALAQDKPKPMDKVNAYASDHDAKVTVTKRGGYYWVEVDGLDPHGTGKTIDEAAEDFMHCVDVMDHEPAEPAHGSSAIYDQRDGRFINDEGHIPEYNRRSQRVLGQGEGDQI
jgi:hypothetical protein